ncbi:MAG: hypothetical protein ACXW30_06765 [Micavibrio sp.]
MGLAKKLAISFGIVVGVPVAAGVLYYAGISSTIHECRISPESKDDKSGALVVRWNFPPLIGERGGKYGIAYLDKKDWIAFSRDSDDRKALVRDAIAYCSKAPNPN